MPNQSPNASTNYPPVAFKRVDSEGGGATTDDAAGPPKRTPSPIVVAGSPTPQVRSEKANTKANLPDVEHISLNLMNAGGAAGIATGNGPSLQLVGNSASNSFHHPHVNALSTGESDSGYRSSSRNKALPLFSSNLNTINNNNSGVAGQQQQQQHQPSNASHNSYPFGSRRDTHQSLGQLNSVIPETALQQAEKRYGVGSYPPREDVRKEGNEAGDEEGEADGYSVNSQREKERRQAQAKLKELQDFSGGGGGAGGRGSGSQSHGPSSFFKLPLFAVLGFECLLVVAAFVALVVMTSVMMDSATQKLVDKSVAGDLSYARARIVTPIQSYERMMLSLRQSYISNSELAGRDVCADSGVISDSQGFFTEAVITTKHNPLVSYIYHLRRSDVRLHPIEGLPDVVECDVTPTYIAVIGNTSKSTTTDGITFEDLRYLDALPTEPDLNDYYYEDYVPFALSLTKLTWSPYLYFETVSNVTELYLSAYAPIKVTHSYANGTNATFVPDLFAPEVKSIAGAVVDPATGDVEMPVKSVAVSTYGLDVGMTTFITLMRGITPKENGQGQQDSVGGGDEQQRLVDSAHTSLYDLASGTLVCTSSDELTLFNGDGAMWPAGQTPSTAVNDAYAHALKFGDFTTGNDGGSAKATYASLEDENDSPAIVKVHYEGDKVISTVRVTTSSGINFVIVQSTPRSHYFGPIVRLRMIMIIVGVFAAVAVVVVCILIGLAIGIPLRHVSLNMQLSAAMKNDRVESTTSFLSEVSSLCFAFDRMNAKLLQARAFMPQAMLIDSSDEATANDRSDDDDEDMPNDNESYNEDMYSENYAMARRRERRVGANDDGEFDNDNDDDDESRFVKDDSTFGGGSTASSHAVTVRTAGVGQLSAANRGGNGKGRSDKHHATRKQDGKALIGKKKKNAMKGYAVASDAASSAVATTALASQKGNVPYLYTSQPPALVIKKITLLVVNTRGFHDKISLASPASILHPTSELTSLLQSISLQEKAVIDSFHGDHFVLSFNAVKTNAMGPLKAVRAAGLLIQSGGVGGQSNQAAGSVFVPTGGSANRNSATAPVSTTALTFFSMGISTGKAAVGHLGTSTLKRLSLIGKVYSRAMALERVARLVGEREQYFTSHFFMRKGGEREGAGGEKGYTSSPTLATVQCVLDKYVYTDISHSHVLQNLGWVSGKPFDNGGYSLSGGGAAVGGVMGANAANGGATKGGVDRIYSSVNRAQPQRATIFGSQQLNVNVTSSASHLQNNTNNANTQSVINNNPAIPMRENGVSPAALSVNTLYAFRPHPSTISPALMLAFQQQQQLLKQQGGENPAVSAISTSDNNLLLRAAGLTAGRQQQQVATADEWLYELENISGSDALFVAVNKAMVAFADDCCRILVSHRQTQHSSGIGLGDMAQQKLTGLPLPVGAGGAGRQPAARGTGGTEQHGTILLQSLDFYKNNGNGSEVEQNDPNAISSPNPNLLACGSSNKVVVPLSPQGALLRRGEGGGELPGSVSMSPQTAEASSLNPVGAPSAHNIAVFAAGEAIDTKRVTATLSGNLIGVSMGGGTSVFSANINNPLNVARVQSFTSSNNGSNLNNQDEDINTNSTAAILALLEASLGEARTRLGASLDEAVTAIFYSSSPLPQSQRDPTEVMPPPMASSQYFWGYVSLQYARMAAAGLNVDYSV